MKVEGYFQFMQEKNKIIFLNYNFKIGDLIYIVITMLTENMGGVMCLCFWKSLLVIASTAFIVLFVLLKILKFVFPKVDRHNISGKHVMVRIT